MLTSSHADANKMSSFSLKFLVLFLFLFPIFKGGEASVGISVEACSLGIAPKLNSSASSSITAPGIVLHQFHPAFHLNLLQLSIKKLNSSSRAKGGARRSSRGLRMGASHPQPPRTARDWRGAGRRLPAPMGTGAGRGAASPLGRTSDAGRRRLPHAQQA